MEDIFQWVFIVIALVLTQYKTEKINLLSKILGEAMAQNEEMAKIISKHIEKQKNK